MKLIGLVPLAGIVILMVAAISDGLAEEKTIYDKQCIERGQKAEIESYNKCGDRTNSVVCHAFDHDRCLVEQSGNPPTGWAYFAGILMVISGCITFGLMWFSDRKLKHQESMKALS